VLYNEKLIDFLASPFYIPLSLRSYIPPSSVQELRTCDH
jgi:hypothetical protein